MRLPWADSSDLNASMDKMKTNFVDKGIPVIIGEYGFAYSNKTNNPNALRQQSETLYYYNRNNASFVDIELVSGFNAVIGGNAPPTPIANYTPLAVNKTPAYYTIKGEPLGSAKPARPGVYLVKQGSSVRKIVVR